MKACTLCGESKPLDEFHRNKAGKDGRQSRCKQCASAAAIRWRQEHPDAARKSDHKYVTSDAYRAKRKDRRNGEQREVILKQKRASHARNREKNNEASRRYREAHPDKIKERRDLYYRKNREVVLARNAEWQRKNIESLREYRRFRTYGVTPEQVEALLAEQGGVCAICRGEMHDRPYRGGIRHGINVDHNHATGAVRGLVCAPCNIVLGHARDDPGRLRAAAEYLERYQ